MLFVSSGGYQEWERLLDIVCTLANRKLWLRQECGWLLFNSICNLSVGFASLVLEHLNLHKLIRTPEGVAIWLEVSKRLPKAQLPKHVWKHGDPLNHHEIDSLAGILKDAKPKQSAHEDSKLDSQGKGMWSPFLHFVWDVVLRDLGEVTADANKANKGVLSRRVEFRDFWSQAVEREYYGTRLAILTDLSQRVSSPTRAAQKGNTGACSLSAKFLQRALSEQSHSSSCTIPLLAS